VTADYTVFLGRLPSSAEVDQWLSHLEGSGGSLTLAEVAADVAWSPEYAARAGMFLG
jgi:hypothetical protein